MRVARDCPTCTSDGLYLSHEVGAGGGERQGRVKALVMGVAVLRCAFLRPTTPPCCVPAPFPPGTGLPRRDRRQREHPPQGLMGLGGHLQRARQRVPGQPRRRRSRHRRPLHRRRRQRRRLHRPRCRRQPPPAARRVCCQGGAGGGRRPARLPDGLGDALPGRPPPLPLPLPRLLGLPGGC